jgi:hypothetical protein
MGLILADTNIVIYMLNGDETIIQFFDENTIAISFITELELLSGKKFSSSQLKLINQVTQKFSVYPMDNSIKQSCIELRLKYSLKLPDAIIAATAWAHNLPLFTSDKQFSGISEIAVSLYTF